MWPFLTQRPATSQVFQEYLLISGGGMTVLHLSAPVCVCVSYELHY